MTRRDACYGPLQRNREKRGRTEDTVTGLLPRGTATECRPIATHRCDWCESPATGRRPYTVDCPYTGRISVRYEYACADHAHYIETEMQAKRSEFGESDVCREFEAITPEMILVTRSDALVGAEDA